MSTVPYFSVIFQLTCRQADRTEKGFIVDIISHVQFSHASVQSAFNTAQLCKITLESTPDMWGHRQCCFLLLHSVSLLIQCGRRNWPQSQFDQLVFRISGECCSSVYSSQRLCVCVRACLIALAVLNYRFLYSQALGLENYPPQFIQLPG